MCIQALRRPFCGLDDYPIVFTYKLFCKPCRNFSRAAEKKKIRKNMEEELWGMGTFARKNLHNILYRFYKNVTPSIFAVIIDKLLL